VLAGAESEYSRSALAPASLALMRMLARSDAIALVTAPKILSASAFGKNSTTCMVAEIPFTVRIKAKSA
jgi:hypothetical protein